MARASSRIKKQRKSRLKRKRSTSNKPAGKPAKKEISEDKAQRAQSRRKEKSKKKAKQTEGGLLTHLKQYFTHLPTLFLAILAGYLTYLMVINIDPDSIKHFIVPNSYFPFILLTFSTTFFLGSYIFLNTRRGLIFASIIGIMLFLRIQQTTIDWKVASIVFLPFFVLETALTLLQRKFR